MTESNQAEWNPSKQLQLFGREEAERLAIANSADAAERKRRLQQLDVAHAFLTDFPNADDLAFLHSAFCQTFLPHSRPSNNQAVWRRQSGGLSLFVKPGLMGGSAPDITIDGRAGLLSNEEQESLFVGIPFGARARLILIYLQSRALASKSRDVRLGDNVSAWIRSLGIAPSSGPRGTIASVREQALRIGLCSFTIQFDHPMAAKGGTARQLLEFRIAQGLELAAGEGLQNHFPKTVRLAAEFYDHLQEHAVPLDERALAVLSGNSLALDVYALLAHRLPRLERPLKLTWAQLHAQLGSGDKSIHSLAQRIREILPSVGAVYPDANLEVERHGLVLKPSKPAVPNTTRISGLKLLTTKAG